jgi:hypothetical protein
MVNLEAKPPGKLAIYGRVLKWVLKKRWKDVDQIHLAQDRDQ